MKYVAKPVVIEAVQFTGDNAEEIRQEFLLGYGKFSVRGENGQWWPDASMDARIWDKLQRAYIPVHISDWIIKGTKDEFYPCADDVFREKYTIYGPSGGIGLP